MNYVSFKTDEIRKEFLENLPPILAGLIVEGVPFQYRPLYDGWQLIFNWCNADVACHKGTCGNLAGFIESYCFPWDGNDVSILSPENFTEKVIEYWREKAK